LGKRVGESPLGIKSLRLRTPVTIGSRFGDWEVTRLGSSSRGRLHYLVVAGRVTSEETEPPIRTMDDGRGGKRFSDVPPDSIDQTT
jgi:hypothetical protein